MKCITRRDALCAGIVLSSAAAARRVVGAPDRSGTEMRPATASARTVKVPFDLPGYREPTFPDRTFVIGEYGAKPGGEALNTKAIARAIAACAKAGGGRVLVPAGVWLTGPVHLAGGVNLHLADGAELRFSTTYAHYLPVVYTQRGGARCYNYSPFVYARDCTNVAVTGPGKLNGQGRAWWPWKKRQPGMARLFEMGAKRVPIERRVFGTEADGVRPPFIQTIDCRNVLLEGFTAVNGPSWNIHPVTCRNVTIRGVRVLGMGPNNDGIDPDSCRNVVIEDCFLDTGDDCICLKAGRNEDGWDVGKPCENVVVRRCRGKRGHGGITLGSEMSAGIRNVFVHDCAFERPDRAVRIKSLPGRGGVIENVCIQDIEVGRTNCAVNITLRYPRLGSDGKAMPTFRNLTIRNVTCRQASVAAEILGRGGGDFLRDVTLDHLAVASKTGLRAENVRGLVLSRLAISTKSSPVIQFRDVREATIDRATCPPNVDVFLRVDGASTRDIRVRNTLVAGATRLVSLGEGVDADRVRALK